MIYHYGGSSHAVFMALTKSLLSNNLELNEMQCSSTNRSRWTTYTTLEASRTAEIARYAENDNLADIKLKLTCANSIAAMMMVHNSIND